MTDFLDDLCKRVEDAARTGKKLRPVGGGSKHFYGGPLEGEVVDMRPWSGIVDYEPTELVITVKAGTLLSEVEAALSEYNQELAFEPPRFSAHSTIGGVVAAGLSGPARLARGPIKDYLLGCTLLDGKGQLLNFGGVVMKNVAGYDVSRVVPGSMGTLGIATSLSIKVMPKTISETTLVFDLGLNPSIEQINQWQSTPLPINASLYDNGKLFVRLRGARAAIESALKTLSGTQIEQAHAMSLWDSLRDQTHPFFEGEGDIWRLSVPPTTVDLALQGEQLIEWGGGLRWLKPAQGLSVENIRGAAERAGGHATLYRTRDEDARTHAFHTPNKVMLNIQRRLKQQFDPAGVFSINRLSPIL
jgi:glycolate oxidase FAD binding subunit